MVCLRLKVLSPFGRNGLATRLKPVVGFGSQALEIKRSDAGDKKLDVEVDLDKFDSLNIPRAVVKFK